MIGIDTNVLVRYLAQDHAAQAARATTFIETECSSATPGFIALIVLVEVVWVSEGCYECNSGRDRGDRAGSLEH